MTISKQHLHQFLSETLSEKIAHFENMIAETRASNNDTKSSMGDKYETGREMLQQEINNLTIQLKTLKDQQSELEKLKTESSSKVEKGAVVKTENGLFYISISFGKLTFENETFMAISPESPLAKAMSGKSANDAFSLNTISQMIQHIW